MESVRPTVPFFGGLSEAEIWEWDPTGRGPPIRLFKVTAQHFLLGRQQLIPPYSLPPASRSRQRASRKRPFRRFFQVMLYILGAEMISWQ